MQVVLVHWPWPAARRSSSSIKPECCSSRSPLPAACKSFWPCLGVVGGLLRRPRLGWSWRGLPHRPRTPCTPCTCNQRGSQGSCSLLCSARLCSALLGSARLGSALAAAAATALLIAHRSSLVVHRPSPSGPVSPAMGICIAAGAPADVTGRPLWDTTLRLSLSARCEVPQTPRTLFGSHRHKHLLHHVFLPHWGSPSFRLPHQGPAKLS